MKRSSTVRQIAMAQLRMANGFMKEAIMNLKNAEPGVNSYSIESSIELCAKSLAEAHKIISTTWDKQ